MTKQMTLAAEKSNVEKFEDYIDATFRANAAKKTASDLGDRSKYIGASDIGGCLRKAYLQKQGNYSWDINQQITFSRGHLSEGIVEMMLQSNRFELLKQVEATGSAENGFPVAAHIDYIAHFKDVDIVIEAKSSASSIVVPYDSWIMQTQLQMSLLQEKPENKNREIRGYIIAFSSSETPFDNGKIYKLFEVLPNEAILKVAKNRVDMLANALASKCEPEAEAQLYCAKCDYKHNCPAITKITAQTLPEDVSFAIDEIVATKKKSKNIKPLEEDVKGFLEAAGLVYAKTESGKAVSLVKMRGKRAVDIDLLKNVAPDIYSKVECYDRGYSFIKVV